MTANLQKLTTKDLARLMNVSERLIYMAHKVDRLRPDLAAEVEAGRMTIHEAHRIATGREKETSWDRLYRAWNSAIDEDRERLMVAIMRAKP